MSQREAAIRTLIAEIEAYLRGFDGLGIADVRAGIARWKNGPMREIVPSRIRQTAYVDTALDWMDAHGDRKLATAIRAAMPYLEWMAYDPYPRELIGDVYAENHCMASLIGEAGQIGAQDFDLGLFGFGPNILYRDHQHAAPELYAPLTAPHGWRFKSGEPLHWHSSRQPQWNEPWAQHAFKSGPNPYFCVFGWTRDVNVPATMIEAPDWAALEADNPYARTFRESSMPSPDLIIVNANIVTMDPLTPTAEALAATGGRVIALGTTAEIEALAGSDTRIIDAGGRLVLPGLQDTHIHLQDSGRDYAQNAALDDARTVEELVDIIRRFAATHDRPWVDGVGWYTGIFTDENLTCHVLDRAVPDRPSFILASDGHNACLNSLACEQIGLVKGVADPPNGHFVVDDNGVPTGMLHETAIKWAEARMAQPTDQDFALGVKFAAALANRHGITGVLDARVEERHVRVYGQLAAANELTVRVRATALVEPSDTIAGALARIKGFRAANQTDIFTVHSAKFFLDGVLENRTGAMIEPYSDDLGGNASLMFDHDQIIELFTAFDAERFQIHVHTIGDMAVRAALDGLEAARKANGYWPSLHQIAHVQCIDPADILRFRQLGAMMNIQPLWARHEPSVTDVALPMVGEERGRWMYAFRSLIDAGAAYALSSDWGVSTLNPFEIMETAITRQPPGRPRTHPVFLPEQRMTREECVKGYTIHAAEAAWRSADTGSLTPGKYADIIILDRDIFTCDVYDIGDTEVLLTLLAGKEVHRSDKFME